MNGFGVPIAGVTLLVAGVATWLFASYWYLTRVDERGFKDGPAWLDVVSVVGVGAAGVGVILLVVAAVRNLRARRRRG